ncbi:hypothetical protein HDU97_008229 [Phlyctochytrium planicorne]|nr:hypothetical protein HDU97_008229 [Phlyctochytrium planicorne]
MISWSQPPSALDYNPLFLTLLEGLRETEHPHIFLVPEALKAMIEAPLARQKISPLMPLAVAPLRAGLASKEKTVILSSLSLLPRLATCLGKPLLPYLQTILPPVAPHMLCRDAEIRNAVWNALQGLEAGLVGEMIETRMGDGAGMLRSAMTGSLVDQDAGYGGQVRFEAATHEEVLKAIKAKIPSYTSVF